MDRIDAVDVYHVRLPLVYPFATAYGTDEAVEPVLVRLCAGGHIGWGEAQAFRLPTYCPEYAAGVFRVIRDVLAPEIVGRQVDGHRLGDMLAGFKGNPFAKGAIDMAWWDLHARTRGEPLYRVLGGQAGHVQVGADFGIMPSIDELLARIDGAVSAGFRRVKLKCARGWDVDMVAAVRSAFPDLVFHVDCNATFTLDDMDLLARLDRFNLAMIEQPLAHDDLADHAKLQARLATPVCLDESITSPQRARKAIELGACRCINIKPVRMGGHTPALRAVEICGQHAVGFWIGGMVESAIGESHCLAFAAAARTSYPNDVFPGERFFAEDLAEPGLTLSAPSEMTARETPGIGCEPDPDRLARRTVQHAVLRA